MTPNLLSDRIDTPLGAILVLARDGKLVGLSFDDSSGWGERDIERRFPDCKILPTDNPCGFSNHLKAYFSGNVAAIEDIPTEAEGSPFEMRVWAELKRIPPGTTASYGEIAKRVGDKDAARAVGIANNRNPIAIVVPCHRVIGADGTLVGYGGGLERKSWLLRHEGVFLRDNHLDTQADLFE
jgi:methylated-DNA-[protein]-cysteine S-methyltransferase